MMLVWYWREDKEILNLGEHIAPIICDHFGYNWKEYNKRKKCCGKRDRDVMLIIGSELHKHKMEMFRKDGIKTVHVMGQGRGHGDVFDKDKYDVRFHLVRGGLTAQDYDVDCPQGDPGFIMPMVMPMERVVEHPVTYVPHNSNLKGAESRLEELRAKEVVSVWVEKGEFRPALQRIINSDFVLTNSLHCMILCLVYKVPFAVSLLEGENLSFPRKWEDVCMWLGIDFVKVKDYQEGFYWWNSTIKGVDLPDVQHIYDIFKNFNNG